MLACENRNQIVKRICQLFCQATGKSQFSINYRDEPNLQKYCTSKGDLKKGFIRRPLQAWIPVNPLQLNFYYSSKKLSQEVDIGFFQKIQVLGKGPLSKVVLCSMKDSEDLYVVKSLRKQQHKVAKLNENILAQRSALEATNHPFLMNLAFAFQSKDKFFLVTPYAPYSDLYSLIKQRKVMNQQQALFFISQILISVDSLHKMGIVHRDIKLQNILIQQNGYIKLTDFGSVRFMGSYQTDTLYVGTQEYMSPQIVSKRPHSFKTDYWSLGVLLFQLLHGVTPFRKSERKDTELAIMSAQPAIKSQVSQPCKQVIRGLLTKSSEKRLSSLKEIRKLEWFKRVEWQSVQKMKVKCPMQIQRRAVSKEGTGQFVHQLLNSLGQSCAIKTPGSTLPNQLDETFSLKMNNY